MTMQPVNVAINVFGKPVQTALTLLSLDRHCGRHLGKIYFTEENPRSPLERWRNRSQIRCLDLCLLGNHQFVFEHFGRKLEIFRPKHFLFTHNLSPLRVGFVDYRHSIRYQYAFENSDSDFLFLTHNDCHYLGDLVGAMLDRLGDHTGAGAIGQCWNCPAFSANYCDGDRYLDYRPTLEELRRLYEHHPSGRHYHRRNFCKSVRKDPWPLPECRLNEWAALINLRLARPATVPLGSACPLGTLYQAMDTGVEWFRNVSKLGHRFLNVPLDGYVEHAMGHSSLNHEETFLARELGALRVLEQEYAATIGRAEDFLRVCYPDPKVYGKFLERLSA